MKRITTKRVLLLGLAGLFLPGLSSAQEFNYDYVEGGITLYPSVGSQDYIGPEFRASYGITDEWFAFGGLQLLSDDVDLTTWHVGAGYRIPIDADTEAWVGPTLEYQEWEVSFTNFFGDTTTSGVDDTAIGVRGGVRTRISDELQLAGEARLVTGDFDYFGLNGKALFALTPDLDAYGMLDLYDGELGFGGGVRFNF